MPLNKSNKRDKNIFLRPFSFSTIRTKFIVPISLTLVVIFVLLEMSFVFYQSRKGIIDLKNDIEMITSMEKKFLINPLWDYDHDQIEEIAGSPFNNEAVVYIRVYDNENGTNLVTHFCRDDNWKKTKCNKKDTVYSSDIINEKTYITKIVDGKEHVIGLLEVGFTDRFYQREKLKTALFILFFGLICFILVLVLLYSITNAVTKPIQNVTSIVTQATEGTNDKNIFDRIDTFGSQLELATENRKDETAQLAFAFKLMMTQLSKTLKNFQEEVRVRRQTEAQLKRSEEKYRAISNELSEGLTDVFSGLKEISSGNPAVNIPENSKIKLITKLKHTVNVTAKNTIEYVNMSHEFAIVLSELFDVMSRVSKGDLTARVKGDSDIELMESLKKLTNQMIESVAEEIEHRKQAQEGMLKAKEEADSANIAKSEFLANMSHEIRTPMNGVVGFTDMLLETVLTDEQISYANTIKKSGESLLFLIDDILDFSKIEAGKLSFENIDFDPYTVAYEVCELIHLRVARRNVEVLCRIGDEVPAYLKGDPARFRQVLLNLLGNASKFTESGEIELGIDVEEEDVDRVKLHTMVRDTGIGIPEGQLDRIFEVFRQADASTTRKYGGTGLGLPICRKIAEIMDGLIWAQNNPNGGCTFHFTAWLAKSSKNVAKRVTPISLADKKILIVDDNENNLAIVTHMLKSAGMLVCGLTDSIKAVDVLQEAAQSGEPFNVCALDIQMPGLCGDEIAKKIRGLSDIFPTIILLAFSSYLEGDANLCREAGFDAFLPKPINRQNLISKLEALLAPGENSSTKDKQTSDDMQHSGIQHDKYSTRILLAEDNPVNQKLAKLMLTKGGYQVVVANNGREAVERFADAPETFDLIFMDVQMPEMDGMKATKTIRKDGFGTIPIIAMTAHAMKGDREKCIDAGMNDYITKPIKKEHVLQMVDKWVSDKGAVQPK